MSVVQREYHVHNDAHNMTSTGFAESLPPVNHIPFYNARLAASIAGKPKVFEPSGSFEALREQHKLVDYSGRRDSARGDMQEKKYFMPGYTGFVRGNQHISGRTYGEMTRRANDTEYAQLVSQEPIPSSPQNNLNVEMPAEGMNTFANNEKFIKRTYHVPGYTGHVPNVRYTYAQTYGLSTNEQVSQWQQERRRPGSQERSGFASTSRPRMLIPLDSAPLAGTYYSNEAPQKMIPDHLKYLKFYAM